MTHATTVQGYAERLADALPRVRDAIAEAAAASGRSPDAVRLVAVTKGHPPEAIRAACAAGLTDLGENRVEELCSKRGLFDQEGVTWHMIGHVQRRKVPQLLPAVDLVHSIDSLRLAERIDRAATTMGRSVDVLVQVNTSGEGAKGGFPRAAAHEDVLAIAALPALRVRGLMTMAPFVGEEAVLRSAFAGLRAVLDEVRRHDPSVGPHLSMGMTNDLRFAVEEGSTMVRIGTALFGGRLGATGRA
jgi:pyridoxal phosphate enzyme (YggS family)